MSSSTSSVVGDLASAVGDLSSASASALGKLASFGVSNLVVKPLKGAADIIESSFTPSTPSVRSSDVFPESQSISSSDVFPGLVTPNQTGIRSSTRPSFSMSSYPYPMEYQSDLASQAAAIRSAQQAAQLMSVPRVQSSSFNPPSSLPSSQLTLPQSSGLEYPSTIPSSSLTLQPASSFNPSTTVPSSSLTLQLASSFNPSTIPSSSLTFPQKSTTLPSSSLVYPSQTLSASNILPPQPQSQSQPQDYNDFQQMQNLFLPPLEDLDQYDTRYLTQLSPQLDQQVQSVTGRINGMKRKKNPTPEYQNEIRRFSKYKKDLVNYRNTFREQLNYRYQTGTGIWNKSPIIFNNTTPQELLNRLESLGGSLAAGNNGVLPEYIQIAHRLRDLGVISNKQLNKMLKNM